MRARGPVAWVAAVALGSSLLSGCSGEPDPPKPISASSVEGELEAIEDFVPEPGPPCDLESETFLRDADSEDFHAWYRTVDGHRELVVVGIWKIKEGPADRQFDLFRTRFGACLKAQDPGEIRLAPLSTEGDRSTGFAARATGETPGYDVLRAYAWALAHEGADDGKRGPALDHGYLATVWLERTDGTRVSADLDKLMSDQLKQIPGY